MPNMPCQVFKDQRFQAEHKSIQACYTLLFFAFPNKGDIKLASISNFMICFAKNFLNLNLYSLRTQVPMNKSLLEVGIDVPLHRLLPVDVLVLLFSNMYTIS